MLKIFILSRKSSWNIFFIGGQKPGVDLSTVAPHHTPDFYVDDSAISTGIRSMVGLTLDYILTINFGMILEIF